LSNLLIFVLWLYALFRLELLRRQSNMEE